MGYAVMCSSKHQKHITIAQSNARQAKGWATQCYSSNGHLCRQWLPAGSYGTNLQGNGNTGYYLNIKGAPTGVVYCNASGVWRAYFSGVGIPECYTFATGLQAMRWVHNIARSIASGAMQYPHASLGTWVPGYNGP